MVADVSIKNVIGGAPRVLHEESKRLKQKGHNVWILTRQIPGSNTAGETIQGVTELHYRILGNDPIKYIVSSVINSMRLFTRIARMTQFDLINFHQPFSALGVNLSKRSKNVRKLYTFHSPAFKEYETRNEIPSNSCGKWNHKLNVRFRRAIEKYSLNKCSKIRTLSEYMKQELSDHHHIANEKVEVIPGGVDTTLFSPSSRRAEIKNKLEIPVGKTMLLSVRNLVPRMGLENLIYAMADIVNVTEDIFLIIGGEGPLKGELKCLVEHLNIDRFVRFEGFIPDERLPLYYQGADLFILPTTMLEGFGLVTVESLSCGTPVLGTPVGGTKEILAALDDRLLLKGTEPEDISERILYFLNRQTELEDLRGQSRKFILNNYSWDGVVQRVEEIFRDVA
ncbi:MAG: glycosyltransferase family 4 protein [Thermodesulfobacteriota bacterium]|nr:glycosyltransferase family 4 protein [Thermodesulfobacteriota bacterium]